MNTEDAPPSPPLAAVANLKDNLTGWAAIENYLQKHDSGMVKDYADDIDTLLVFAGLFSAVLTAFVVETYTMLQQDSTDTTNQLLEDISATLSGSSRSPGTPASTFTPTTASRWINILFFLSLVFSLSAALFGILAKQWLREYMQWNWTLGVPRENVLIRQTRFEAWQAWNVAATISSIPALLEVAMILFLSGVIILLWTLDTVVAVVVTVSVAAFMGAVCAFTVLPVFFRRCPYKSPTAWACVVLTDFVGSVCALAALFVLEYTRNLRHGVRYWRFTTFRLRWTSRARSWRERDRRASAITTNGAFWANTTGDDTRQALEKAVKTELVGLREDGNEAESAGVRAVVIGAPNEAMKDLCESSLLFRALAWVQQASQDVRLRTHIVESLSSLHTDSTREDDIALAIRNVSNWCLLWSLQTRSLAQRDLGLEMNGEEATSVLSVQRQVRDLWALDYVGHGHSGIVMRVRQRALFGSAHLRVVREHSSTSLFADLIAADLHTAVGRIRAGQCTPTLGRLILELLCVLSTICTRRLLPASSSHLKGVAVLICDNTMRPVLDTACPGLRSSAFIVACRLGRVECNNGTLSVIGSSSMSLASLTSLICNYFTHDIHEYGPEDIHIFILLTHDWLANLNPPPGAPDELARVERVWTKMAALAGFALRATLPNCGCFFALPWPGRLFQMYYNHLPTLLGGRHRAYLRLVHALDAARRRGLLTGPRAYAVEDLMHVVHDGHFELCDVPRCGLLWHPTARAREDADHGGGGTVGVGVELDRRSRSRLAHPQSPQAPSARDAVDFTFEILGGATGTSSDVAAAYVNIWRWFCDPATGCLAAEKVVPFLKSLPPVPVFVLPIYPEEFSVHNLLRQSRRVLPVEATDGSAVVTRVDVRLLMYALDRLDWERTRHRRILFNWMYYRVQSLLDPSGAISFGDMLMLFTQHPSGAMCDGDTSSLQSFVEQNEQNQAVVHIVKHERLRSAVRTLVLRRRFLALRRQ